LLILSGNRKINGNKNFIPRTHYISPQIILEKLHSYGGRYNSSIFVAKVRTPRDEVNGNKSIIENGNEIVIQAQETFRSFDKCLTLSNRFELG